MKLFYIKYSIVGKIVGKVVTKKKDFDLTCELKYMVNIKASLHDAKL